MKKRHLTPHPLSDDLAAGIQRSGSIAFVGKLIRIVGITYANTDDLVSGVGSLKHGGRYNPKGGFRAVYGSLEFDTATAELLAHHRRQGRPDPDADVFPIAAVSLEAEVERLLDLTDVTVRRAMKVSLKDLRGEWQDTQDFGREALTQAIGRLARAAGFQGLLAPSAARPGGRNVVLFLDRLSKNGLRIIRKDKLPKKT
jgi:RES domain-containing protein